MEDQFKKTIEAQSDRYGYPQDFIDGANFAKEYIEKQPSLRWVNIEDNVPDEKTRVLGVIGNTGEVEMVYRLRNDWYCGNFTPIPAVTHWQPLPASPLDESTQHPEQPPVDAEGSKAVKYWKDEFAKRSERHSKLPTSGQDYFVHNLFMINAEHWGDELGEWLMDRDKFIEIFTPFYDELKGEQPTEQKH